MSGRQSRFAVGLCILSMFGCNQPRSRQSPEELTATLSSLIAEAYDFGEPDALERMSALYASSEDVVSASGGRLTVSADSVRRGIARFWEVAGRNMRESSWVWHEVRAEPLGDSAAVLTGVYSIPHIAPDGQPHVIEGAWTAVFRRMGGEWKIVHEHLSVPPE